MHLVFVDDSKQRKPTRPGMNSLVSTGGVAVPVEAVSTLESDIDLACKKYGFPEGEEFKWSPDKKMWMYSNLIQDNRTKFYIEILEKAHKARAVAIVVIYDTKYNSMEEQSPNESFDTFTVFLERVNVAFITTLVIADEPGGNHSKELQFLKNCRNLLSKGSSQQQKFDRILINILTTPSNMVRLLQLADVVTSCTTSYIAGESTYSPQVFEHILPIVRKHNGSFGGGGIKIHPDGRYVNLYHWLLGDEYFNKRGSGFLLPIVDKPYTTGPEAP